MGDRLTATDWPGVLSQDAHTAKPLHGPWLVVARGVWCGLAVLAVTLFIAAVAARYGQLADSPAQVRAELAQLGLSTRVYALAFIVPAAVFAAACGGVGAVIALRKPTDAMALFVSLSLLMQGALYGPNAAALEETYPGLVLPITLGYSFVIGSQVLMLFLFPDGRFVPHWMRFPVLAWVVWLLLEMFLPGEPLAEGPDVLAALLLISGLGAGVAAQIYRYLRMSNTVQRQQTKWVVFGVAVAASGFVLLILPKVFFPSLTQPGRAGILYDMASETVAMFATLLIPVTLGAAILRHRLWDIDLLINRALVYGVLTASTVGIYLVVVSGFGALFPSHGNALVSLVAAALVAVLFAPLRARLQRGINRLMYGERDEPYVVLSRLGQRIGVALAPEAVLPAIAETVREALKLPFAAIALCGDGRDTVIEAMSGQPGDDLLRLPLVYQHENFGELILSPRAPGEAFGPAERRLLEDLARQAGAAAHAVRLNADLQRSRERLVTAREEERRRLRRDLHDGLGPALAAQMLKAGCARTLLADDPAAADALLTELETDLETALTDIRRLVYSLRPPALDELGLIAAIRETAAHYQLQPGGPTDRGGKNFRIMVEAPDCLSPLPAAVEVAAYRITQEALTNVVRHALASVCVVKLAVEEGLLRIEVVDNGVGLPATRRSGVGLTSMRERATELGGTLLIEIPAAGGTRLLACLPVPAEPAKLPSFGGVRGTGENSASVLTDLPPLPPRGAPWTGSAS